MSGQRDIVTPEAVVLGFERAGVASRAGARLLDLLCLAGVYFVLLLGADMAFANLDGLVVAVFTVVVSLGPYLAWFVGFEVLAQRTPGKAAFGLRVVGTDGTPIRFTQAMLRTVTGVVELVTLPIVAVLVALFSRDSQRLGDLAARTMVIRSRSLGPVLSARFTAPYGHEGYAGTLDVGPMTNAQYELVRRYLLRESELSPEARAQVAIRLANPLATLLNHTPPTQVSPQAFLASLAAAWQHLHGGVPLAAPPPAQTYLPPASPPPGYPPPGYPPSAPGLGPAPVPAASWPSDPRLPPPPPRPMSVPGRP